MKLIGVSVLKEWVENWFTKNRFYHPYAKNNNIPIPELYDILEQMPSAEPGIVRCKECKHFHYDMPYVIQGIPILGHEVCDFWGDGCKTNENGFCSYAERRTDE